MPSLTPFHVRVDRTGPTQGVGVLMLDAGSRPVVVLDEVLVRRLDRTLCALPRGLRGLVVASSSERSFVAGADLKAIMALSDSGLHQYLAYASEVYARLCWLPFPTAAAIHAATLGGGLELAMHCDGLLACPGVKPYPVGLPEAGLGICPGWGGTAMLASRIDPADALRRTANGTTFLYDDAVKAGLFDEVASDRATLIEAAKRWVADRSDGNKARDGAPMRHAGRSNASQRVREALGSVEKELSATATGEAVASCVRAACSRGWRACLRAEQGHLVRLRGTPAAQQAIDAFFAKSK